jgi:hypothetical protein
VKESKRAMGRQWVGKTISPRLSVAKVVLSDNSSGLSNEVCQSTEFDVKVPYTDLKVLRVETAARARVVKKSNPRSQNLGWK